MLQGGRRVPAGEARGRDESRGFRVAGREVQSTTRDDPGAARVAQLDLDLGRELERADVRAVAGEHGL